MPGNEAIARVEVDLDPVALVLGDQPQQRVGLCGQVSVRLQGNLHVVPLGDRQHAGEMIANDVEPLLVGPALGIFVAVGRDDRAASEHIGPNDGLVEHFDARVAPDRPVGVDRDEFQAVLRHQIADHIGIVVDGSVGRFPGFIGLRKSSTARTASGCVAQSRLLVPTKLGLMITCLP